MPVQINASLSSAENDSNPDMATPAKLLSLLLPVLFNEICERFKRNAVPILSILGRPKNAARFDSYMPNNTLFGVYDFMIFKLAGTKRI